MWQNRRFRQRDDVFASLGCLSETCSGARDNTVTGYRPKNHRNGRRDEEVFLLVESNPSTIVERCVSRDFFGNLRGRGRRNVSPVAVHSRNGGAGPLSGESAFARRLL